eukprot:scaffold587_cov339-Prasinococcus_capsulatus_cf.AAC.12
MVIASTCHTRGEQPRALLKGGCTTGTIVVVGSASVSAGMVVAALPPRGGAADPDSAYRARGVLQVVALRYLVLQQLQQRPDATALGAAAAVGAIPVLGARRGAAVTVAVAVVGAVAAGAAVVLTGLHLVFVRGRPQLSNVAHQVRLGQAKAPSQRRVDLHAPATDETARKRKRRTPTTAEHKTNNAVREVACEQASINRASAVAAAPPQSPRLRLARVRCPGPRGHSPAGSLARRASRAQSRRVLGHLTAPGPPDAALAPLAAATVATPRVALRQ